MKFLKIENVQICQSASDWREAIKISVIPLELGGYVKECYKEEIIENVEKLGAYILITENIAMPHARPEQGVIKTQIALTLFRQGVMFDGKDTPAKLFITLAAADNDSHVETLSAISEILSDDDKIFEILNSSDETMLYKYFENL